MRAICRRSLFVPSFIALALLGAGVVSAPPAGAATDIYASAANWICRPDKSDPCDQNLNTTVIQGDGRTSIETFTPNAGAPVDCFYVYPTASWDSGDNSDRSPGTYQEVAATRTQAARFGSQCRLYVPVYRQVTSTWYVNAYLSSAVLALPDDLVETAYADVVAAFRHYLAVDNQGRGFVLIGHSQGSEMLTLLIQREIAPNPAIQARLVSALLLGLPAEEHPPSLPACTAATQTGCLVAYQSFRATNPPDPDSGFARSSNPADCTNPARLGGGSAVLRPYFPTSGTRWTSNGRYVSTPFVAVPGLVSGACVSAGGFTYLSITVNAVPSDTRTDNIPGDMGYGLDAEFGLHLSDMQLAQGDLVDLVGQQGRSFAATR